VGDDVISRSGISYLMTSLGDNSPTLQVYEAVTLVLMTTGHKEVIFLNRLQWQNVLTKFHKKNPFSCAWFIFVYKRPK
jgi:hypothetical protein